MQISVEQFKAEHFKLLMTLALVLSTPAILGVDMIAQPAPVEKQSAAVSPVFVGTSVADFASSDSPTAGIQEAIDALGENGGVVTIPLGEYLLRRSIRVRSNVTLQGAGEETVLRKVAQLGSKLVAPADAESRSVRVQDAAGFREGDEIGLFDQTTVGWLHVHAVVKGVQGNELLLDRRLGRAFEPAEGGGLRDSVFSENEARGNKDDGFYFCVRVERVVVRNNKFTGNKGNGVGGLGDGGDKHNIVENNLCERNGRCGIALWDGDNNTVRNNTCVNNSQSSPGRWSGILLAKTERSVVSGNRCFDNQQVKTQKHGIEELSDCRANTITNNDCRGNAQSGLALAGLDGQQDGNLTP